MRNDVGALWENFLIAERLKKAAYRGIFANRYFWRTWERQEIDVIEEREGKLFGYEMKWGGKDLIAPRAWVEAYPGAMFEVINRENYLEFTT